ncbi:MAG: Gfo/Idh/MocA family oxidoreductase [Clostridiaceae bacterium]|nr:Gfo/Idh/MocA family oxidoreductase [Clostridiaceae bacterium]
MKNFQQVNVGVIGVGWFGEKHAQVYNNLSGSNLIGVFDTNTETKNRVASALGVQSFSTINDLLADDSIDAVSICVKDQYHLQPVLAAAKAGKHIMLEKPMALNLEECNEMINAVKAAGVKLMLGHLLRFNQRIVRASYKIRAGEIGDIRHIYARRNMPTSAPRHVGDSCGFHSMLFHGAVHELDLLQWLANDDIVEVFARHQSGIMESENVHVSDTILTYLQFRNGAAAITEHSWIYPDNFPAMVDARTDITGTHGRIELDLGFRGGRIYNEKGVEYFENPHWPVIDDWYSCDLRDELETFIKCVSLDLPVPVTGADGRRAIAVALAIEASMNSKKVEQVES